MIAVDTNLLLRFVVRDDVAQFKRASTFFGQRTARDPAFISLIVLAEFVWALRRRYGYPQAAVRELVSSLFETAEIAFEDEASLSAVVNTEVPGDIADHLIAYSARRAGCETTVTFDEAAAKAIPSMVLLA
jgi:predicted nucleic-acid-binding protein